MTRGGASGENAHMECFSAPSRDLTTEFVAELREANADITCTAQVQERGGCDEEHCNEPSQKRTENWMLKVCGWCDGGNKIGQVGNESTGKSPKEPWNMPGSTKLLARPKKGPIVSRTQT